MFAKPPSPALQVAHPLAQGLLGAWLFSASGGNRATDSGHDRMAGTLVNAPVWGSDRFGCTLVFNGTTQSVSLVAGAAPVSVPPRLGNIAAQRSGYSFSAWVRTTSSAAITTTASWGCGCTIIEARNIGAPGDSRAWSWGTEGGKLATARTTNTAFTGAFRVPSVASVNDGQWHHIATTVADNDVSHYIDGVLDSVGSHNVVGANGDCSVRGGTTNVFSMLAARANNTGVPTSWWQGTLDHVMIWGRALSAQDVRQLHADAFVMFRPRSRISRVFSPSGAPPPIAVSVAEALATADTTTAAAASSASAAEALTLVETAGRTATTTATVSEALVFVETSGSAQVAGAALAEALALADAPSATPIVLGGVAEALALADDASAAGTRVASVIEALAVSDTATAAASQRVDLAESAALADTVAATLVLAASAAETLVLDDTASGFATLLRAVAEALALADRPRIGTPFELAVAEALALTDRPALLTAASGDLRALHGPGLHLSRAGPARNATRVGPKRELV